MEERALKFGHYEVLPGKDGKPWKLGSGAMGHTYKARDTRMEKIAVIKIMLPALRQDPVMKERFFREARALARIEHPRIARIHYMSEDVDTPFFAMEFCDGLTLQEAIKKHGKIAPAEALRYLRHLAEALEAVEKAGLVHRDIKPSNIILTPGPRGREEARLVDFGVAYFVNQPEQESAHPQDQFFGTIGFAAPEQFEAGVKPDIRADFYALGNTLWCMLAGRPPFAGTAYEVNFHHLKSAHPFEQITDVPAPVLDLLRSLLDKNREKRPSDSAALLDQIREVENSLTVNSLEKPTSSGQVASLSLSLPPVTGEPDRAPAGGGALAFAGMALLMLAMAGGGWWFFTQESANAKKTSPEARVRPVAVTPTAPLIQLSPPQEGQPWENSLKLRFIPVGSFHMATTETRVRDFEAFVQAEKYDADGGMYSLQKDGFKQYGRTWKNPGFPQTPEHPVVGISWDDADSFCRWLTKTERAAGALTSSQMYRLPTDLEWSQAVGLPAETTGATPEERSGKVKSFFPWGKQSLSAEKGNYAGAEARENAPDSWAVIPDFTDPAPRTCAVSSFAATPSGLFDIGGNAWEWCQDLYNSTTTTKWRVARGGSWATSNPNELLASYRRGLAPTFRHDDVGFRCVIATGN